MEQEVHAYSFPTTVMMVDDNRDFLSNFSLQLDSGLAYRLFDSPASALKYLNRPGQPAPLYQRCFSHYRDVVGWSMTDHLIRLDVSVLEQGVAHPDRFAEVSVVLVDYDMPGLDGVSFCAQIDNPRIKKVLLTGVGDEKVAVRAFNEGVIDRFISKSQRNVAEQVNAAIAELQQRYFRDVSRMIRDSLSLESPVFLQDPVFQRYFGELRRERGFIEYYLTAEPAGFLLADAQGALARLLVAGEADLRAQWEIAVDQDCPPELADMLSSGEALPYFWATEGFYRPDCRDDWRRYMHPARKLTGIEGYYVALLENPPLRNPVTVSSYNQYLDWLDRQTSSP